MAGSDCLYWDFTCWVRHYCLELGKIDWDLVAFALHEYLELMYLTGPWVPIVE